MKAIDLGATVREIQAKPLEGVVIERRFNEAHSEMEYHVDLGDGQAKWFLESQVNELPGAA